MARAKGFSWSHRRIWKHAKQAVVRAGANAYRDRRAKKQEFRKLWTIRINAAVRPHDLSYSVFIDKLKKNGVALNRKVLSELAAGHKELFDKLVAHMK